MKDIGRERIELEFGACWYDADTRAYWFERNEVPADSIGKIERMFTEQETLLRGINRAHAIGASDLRRGPTVKPEHEEFMRLRATRTMAGFHCMVIILQTAKGRAHQKAIIEGSSADGKVFLFNHPDVAYDFIRSHPPP